MELLKIANCFDNSVFNSLKKNTCRFCCMTNLFRNRERWIIIFTVHLLTGVYKFATFFIQLLLRLSWHHLSAYHNINLLSLKKMYYFSTAVSYEYRSKIVVDLSMPTAKNPFTAMLLITTQPRCSLISCLSCSIINTQSKSLRYFCKGSNLD